MILYTRHCDLKDNMSDKTNITFKNLGTPTHVYHTVHLVLLPIFRLPNRATMPLPAHLFVVRLPKSRLRKLFFTVKRLTVRKIQSASPLTPQRLGSLGLARAASRLLPARFFPSSTPILTHSLSRKYSGLYLRGSTNCCRPVCHHGQSPAPCALTFSLSLMRASFERQTH